MKRLLIALLVLAGCSTGSHGGSGSFAGGSTTAPATSATTATPVSATPLPTPAELARRHAPVYRFNAWIAGDSSVQDRDEDFFPESVVRFFDEISTLRARVTVQLANRSDVGISQVVSFTGPVTIDSKHIYGFPQRMAGDAPGDAPVYFHAWKDPASSVRNPDGSGEDLWYVEYWLFYPKDLCLVTIATIPLPIALGGHRGDWESTSFAIAVLLGPGGSFQSSEVRRGYYNGHNDKFRCQRAELELLNEHPVSYVSVGKHAEYPEPGKWLNRFGLAPFAHMDEYFLGNGFEWDAAQSALIDLDGPLSNEFAPPSFIAIPSPYTDWRDFPGGWGPDAGFGPLAGSPCSPKWATVWNQGDAGATDWATRKSQAPPTDLLLGPVPRVTPAPVPTRR